MKIAAPNLQRLIFALVVFAVGVTDVHAADEALNKKLYEAVLFMDAPKVKEILAQGADANFIENGRSLLGWASQTEGVEIVDALLAAKANPNFVDGVGHTPLMRAIETGQTKVFESLLKATPDFSVKNRKGGTALLMAVENRRPAMLRALIAAGADVKVTDKEGYTPALVAAQDGLEESKEIIKILGEAKADMNGGNIVYTPLTYAISQTNKDLVKALLDAGADPNAVSQNGNIPLLEAAGDAEITKLLVAAKANPNVANAHGETPIFRAIENGTAEIVEALIKAGAEINKPNGAGESPLRYASSYAKTDMVEALKKAGATE